MDYSHPKKRQPFFHPGNYENVNQIDSNIIWQFDKSCYNDFNIYTSHEPCNHKLTLAGFVHRNSNVGKVFGSLGWAFYFFNPGPAEKSAKIGDPRSSTWAAVLPPPFAWTMNELRDGRFGRQFHLKSLFHLYENWHKDPCAGETRRLAQREDLIETARNTNCGDLSRRRNYNCIDPPPNWPGFRHRIMGPRENNRFSKTIWRDLG